ncbi:MAG: alpha/beta hydrolase-fold protein [Candidatus Aminicenantes bacterium]|nr:alpha/beta hydrolase-fold protein [Candidatus Aminicenantes bacterium]
MTFPRSTLLIFLTILLLFLAGISFGEPTASADGSEAGGQPIQAVRVEKIASAKVGETREFWVSLPDGYADSGERYPVLYMMDADFNFSSGIIGGVRFAALMGQMPEFIMVGIKNTDRSKDIFPEVVTYRDGSKDGGRAGQYLDFIREELIPHIDKNYRTEKFRVLYGTSNTGFTTVYALFRNPDTADAYIAASATLSIPLFRAKRDEWIQGFKGGRRRLVVVMGENDLPTVLSQNGALKEAIDTQAPPDLIGRFLVVENGGHVPVDSLRQGLSALFEGWKIDLPFTDATFDEIRKQAERRAAKFGVPGKLPEDDLAILGRSLLGEKKELRAVEVLRYRADLYPRSAEAQVALGDAYRQSGQTAKARECYDRALIIAPGHAAATAKRKELDSK